ncbi:MAG TPA: MFS transporter [Gammaproteobacteria bacterium]|nr:MFS transporter [Gammaproteobacteria bacterium]
MRQKLRAISSLFNLRTFSILFLGFSSGLPLALSGTTLQAWFAQSNISLETIGFLSLVGQPYVYKFLWAPVLDRFVPPFLGRRRGWIALMQLALSITLVFMALGDPKAHGFYLASLACALAFFSATQDIGIDAYRTDVLPPEERGLGASFTITGYRIAMMVSGGLALILAGSTGFKITYLVMAALMLATTIITLISPEPVRITPPHTLKETVVKSFKEFITRPQALLVLLFLLLYKFGDAFTVSLTTAFLMRSLHFSLAILGVMYKIVAFVASIVGGILGGIVLSRISLFRALLIFGFLQALCSFLFMALAIAGHNIPLLAGTIFADYFFSGMSAAALIVFMTALCDKKFSATQFALFSAISAFSRVFVGPLSGYCAQTMGWPHYFVLSFFLSLPGLLLLWALRNSYYGKSLKLQGP